MKILFTILLSFLMFACARTSRAPGGRSALQQTATSTSTNTSVAPTDDCFAGLNLPPPPIHAVGTPDYFEHLAFENLFLPSTATTQAVQSGDWNAASTWNNSVPTDGAIVYIPNGLSVTIGAELTARIKAIRVQGSLLFNPSVNTSLFVETLLIEDGAFLSIGTPSHPVASNVSSSITFIDNGPISASNDPHLLSRGLIAHGAVCMIGSSKTSFVSLGGVTRNTTMLNLDNAPSGWVEGDQVVLTGASAGASDEILSLSSINGAVATVPPLAYSHPVPSTPNAQQPRIHLANLSRNIVLTSENVTTIAQRGHVMFLHSDQIRVENVKFLSLGRTDKRVPVDDSIFDANGNLLRTGTNQRGRYPVHFHKGGAVLGDDGGIVRGCVVEDGPGWGFVNHGSQANMDSNIAYNLNGAGFVTEGGDELGRFNDNLAAHINGCTGSDCDMNLGLKQRTSIQDFGYVGHGFWAQSPAVTYNGNIATGVARGSGFAGYFIGLFTAPYCYAPGNTGTPGATCLCGPNTIPSCALTVEPLASMSQVEFPLSNLSSTLQSEVADPTCGPNNKQAPATGYGQVECVPFTNFTNNTGYDNYWGFQIENHNPLGAQSGNIASSFFWGNQVGAFFAYTSNLALNSDHILGDVSAPSHVGVHSPPEGFIKIYFNNLVAEGLSSGINFSQQNDQHVVGGYYNNITNFVIPTALNASQSITFSGSVALGTLGGSSHVDFSVTAPSNLSVVLDEPINLPFSLNYNGSTESVPSVVLGMQQLLPVVSGLPNAFFVNGVQP